ncbi:unnamed protein product, partial [Ectocarpus sp. 13 AM-2016]
PPRCTQARTPTVASRTSAAARCRPPVEGESNVSKTASSIDNVASHPCGVYLYPINAQCLIKLFEVLRETGATSESRSHMHYSRYAPDKTTLERGGEPTFGAKATTYKVWSICEAPPQLLHTQVTKLFLSSVRKVLNYIGEHPLAPTLCSAQM